MTEVKEVPNQERENISLEKMSSILNFKEEKNIGSLNDTGMASGKSSHLPPVDCLLDDEDLEAQLRRHSFASHPLTKMVVVFGGMLLVVLVAGVFLSAMQVTGGEYATSVRVQDNGGEGSASIDKDQEKAELLSELALREQKERLRRLEEENKAKEKTTSPSLPKKSIPTPPTPAPVAQTPLRQVVQPRQTKPSQKGIDPYSQWHQLSLAGSYGGKGSASISSPSVATPSSRVQTTPNRNNSQVQLVSHDGSGKVGARESGRVGEWEQGRVGERESGRAGEWESWRILSPHHPITTSSPLGMKISKASVGQTVSATLSAPLAWEAMSTLQEVFPPAMITLHEPIVDAKGSEMIPVNSTMVATLNPSSLSGLVQLEITEIILADGGAQAIPPGSLLIRDLDGTPLVAEFREVGGEEGGGLDSGVIFDALSVFGDVADIPGARSIHLLGRRNRHLLPSRRRLSAAYWYLPSGIELTVRVIKPFSMETEEEPMELELEAIDLTPAHAPSSPTPSAHNLSESQGKSNQLKPEKEGDTESERRIKKRLGLMTNLDRISDLMD